MSLTELSAFILTRLTLSTSQPLHDFCTTKTKRIQMN